MRIMGIDPGLAIVGYCVMDYDQTHHIVDCGSIQTSKHLSAPQRLVEIHKDLLYLVEKYKPDVAAVEQLFFFKNAKTITSVSEARGVIIMTMEMLGVTVFEYTPLEVKQAITGYGRACKDEVKDMIQILCQGQDIPKLDDTTDAIAIAVCQTMFNN